MITSLKTNDMWAKEKYFITDVFRSDKEQPILSSDLVPKTITSTGEEDTILQVVLIVISCVTGLLFVTQVVVYVRYFLQRHRRVSVHLPVASGVTYGDRKAAVVATAGRFKAAGGDMCWQSELFARRVKRGQKRRPVDRPTSFIGQRSVFSISSASSSSNSARRSPYEMATPYPCTLTETITSQSERDLSYRVSDVSHKTSSDLTRCSSFYTVKRSGSSIAGKSRLSLSLPPTWGEDSADSQHKENPGYDTESSSSRDKITSDHKSTSATEKMTSRSHSNASDTSQEAGSELYPDASACDRQSTGNIDVNFEITAAVQQPMNSYRTCQATSDHVTHFSRRQEDRRISHLSRPEDHRQSHLTRTNKVTTILSSPHSPSEDYLNEMTSHWTHVSQPAERRHRRRRKRKTVIKQPKGRKALSLGGLWPEALVSM